MFPVPTNSPFHRMPSQRIQVLYNIRAVRRTGCRWKTASTLNPEGLLHDAVQHIPSIVINVGNRIGFRKDKKIDFVSWFI